MIFLQEHSMTVFVVTVCQTAYLVHPEASAIVLVYQSQLVTVQLATSVCLVLPILNQMMEPMVFVPLDTTA